MTPPPRTEAHSPVTLHTASGLESKSSHPGIEALEVPWTGISLLAIVLSLILFMALPRGTERSPLSDARAKEQSAIRVERQLALAIREYRHDHGEWPGLAPTQGTRLAARPKSSTAWLTRQLCLASNARGEISPLKSSEYPYGPYLLGELPINPRTGLRSVRLVEEGSAPSSTDEACGWIYDPRTGEVRGARTFN
jgi:type II secretory pathway pseudopilin PulG